MRFPLLQIMLKTVRFLMMLECKWCGGRFEKGIRYNWGIPIVYKGASFPDWSPPMLSLPLRDVQIAAVARNDYYRSFPKKVTYIALHRIKKFIPDKKILEKWNIIGIYCVAGK